MKTLIDICGYGSAISFVLFVLYMLWFMFVPFGKDQSAYVGRVSIVAYFVLFFLFAVLYTFKKIG